MKRLTTVALIAGLCTVVGLFLSSGLEDVAAAVVSAGWGALVVVLARAVAVAWAGLGWYAIFPAAGRPSLPACINLRFVREGINTLLPVAAVGGDFVGARLLTKRGVAGGLAGASMFVDLMTQALTQLLFTLAGLGILVWLAGDGPIVRTVAGGLAVAAPAIGAFYLIQRRAGHRLIQGIVHRFAASREWQALGAVEMLYDNLRRLYAAPLRILSGIGIHLVGWIIGTLEVYVCLHFMGYPVSFAEALVIESLAQAVRGAAFAVPGALGAQEGGLIALCALFGIPVEAALALSLVKRLADLLVGVPGLLLWHAQEGRIGRDAAEAEASGPAPGRQAIRRLGTAAATLGPFYSYAPPRGTGARAGETEAAELKKCA